MWKLQDRVKIDTMIYEQFLLSLCLWREVRGQSQAARAAVAAVIRNRSTDAEHRWPKTIPGVILQPRQFSSFNAGDPNAVLFPVPSNVQDWEAWQDCCDVATMPLTADPTQGANSYESEPAGMLPRWADPEKITVIIGPFRFYKL